MGAVETTYTFGATDTITSTKMNNIIDQTTMTSTACLSGGGLEVANGQLAISLNAINNSRLATNSVTSENIVDGTIVNADINASAAIAGTKISPNFGTQNIQTTGNVYLERDTGVSIFQANSGTVSGQLYSSSTNSSVAIGSVSNNPLVAFTNNTERMRITASGNVGIGTNSPIAPLHVQGQSVTNADPELAITGSSGYIYFHNSLTSGSYNGIVSSGDKSIIFSDGTSGTGSFVIAPWQSNTSGIRINSSGNVGICKASPSTALDVNGTVTATAFAGPLTGNVTGNVTGNLTGSSGSCTGNSATATNLSTNINNWSTNGTISAVVGQLGWKNFGNGHTIFDASAGTTPNGVSKSNINAEVAWQGGLPNLMGWNGTNTHGVRVDTARLSESCSGNAATATTASTVSNSAITAAKLNGNQSGDAPIFGVRAWANINGTVGSVSVRQGGNVSGVVRDQLGRYTITFSTPMQDTNYAIIAWARDSNATDNNYFVSAASNATKTTGSFQIEVNSPGGTVDSPEIGIMVIR